MDEKREAYIKGAQSMLNQWVPIISVVKVLESYRFESLRNKSHSGDFAENLFYRAIEEVEELLPPPVIEKGEKI